jgi:hypothetical protein
MGDPGYGPLCGELEQAYRLMADLTRDVVSMDDGAQRTDAVQRLETVSERIRRCESWLLVVSYGKEACCDLMQERLKESPSDAWGGGPMRSEK